ncbi:phosphatase PAP2 family protein [Mesobacillus subterraneus]|uniref:phosphatase PAP2 family protein n=1 Tax=Mesobacillus subterraneus TaxID=285983 RepID=UPI00203F330C|nr:phosphatase PAP2 family protein [Mesobacillus subterraneus]MCM3685368.1 phosphatase PAP2 family protein [Mesobacillus subterraneus]
MKFNLQLLISFLGSLFGFIVMSYLVKAEHLVMFDRVVMDRVQGLEAAGLTAAMKFFTYIGSLKFIVIMTIPIFLVLFYVLKHRLEILVFLSVVYITPILNRLLKMYFHRARPDFNRLIEIGGYSFPSGHAMNAFSFYSIFAFLLWRHVPTVMARTAVILLSTFMILAIGLSRVYLGVHYPSDIIGGFLASGLWVAAVIWFFQRYKEKLEIPARNH